MYYNQSFAAKGNFGNRERHPMFNRNTMQRAAVNIYKTGDSYVLLVFAPGRIREHFKLDVKGDVLTVSYQPPTDFPRPDWVQREYSRGGFERSFTLDGTFDTEKIAAKYVDGVLEVTLPVVAGTQAPAKEIVVG